jgi:hypothetical protein
MWYSLLLSVVVNIGLSYWEKKICWQCLRIECWGKHFPLRVGGSNLWHCILHTKFHNYYSKSNNFVVNCHYLYIYIYICHESTEESGVITLLSVTFVLHGVGSWRHASAALPTKMTQYPLYTRVGGPQCRYVRMRKISPSRRFDPWNVYVYRYETLW